MIDALLAARAFDLSHPFEHSAVDGPRTRDFTMSTLMRHGDLEWSSQRLSASLELVTMTTHTGTHIDAPGHFSSGGKLHGGSSAEDAQRGGRLSELGVESVAPLVYRGVLLDVASARGVDRLEASEGVDRDELERVCRLEGVDVGPGTAVLVRTGWGARERYGADEYFVSPPGPDPGAADWLVGQGVRLAGSDTHMFEQANPDTPVHKALLVDAGVYLLENLFLEELAEARAYEFALIVAPLPLVGASGAPVRPLAIVP
jgi:kynurenine formamidase